MEGGIMKNLMNVFGGLLFLSLSAVSAHALEYQYCMDLALSVKDSGELVSKAQCSVLQTMDQENSAAKWSCSFNGKPVEQLTTEADRIGYSYEFAGGYYSEYLVYRGSQLGRYFFAGFGLEGVINNTLLQTQFGKDAPLLTENPLPVKQTERAFLLKFENLHYGNCSDLL